MPKSTDIFTNKLQRSNWRLKSKSYLLMIGTPVYMLAVLIVLLAGLYLGGFKLLNVQSDSMEPTLSQGDVVLMNTREKAYIPGQVVAYRSLIDEHILITHRLVDEYHHGKHVVTQGDALETRDPLIPRSQIEGRIIAVLPMLGTLTAPFRSAYAVNMLIYTLAAVIIVQEVRRAALKIAPAKYHLNRYNRAM